MYSYVGLISPLCSYGSHCLYGLLCFLSKSIAMVTHVFVAEGTLEAFEIRTVQTKGFT